MKKLAALMALAALAVIPRVDAHGIQLAIAPAKSEHTAQPGSEVRAAMTLKNSSNELITVTVSAKDFTASEQLNGEPKLLDEPNVKYGISNWFTASNTNRTLSIPGNQTITYEATFRVPTTAAQRTYFGSVQFSGADDHGGTSSVGGLVFITVGNPSTALEVTDLKFGESDEATKKHGIFTATIGNTGDGIAKPNMRLRLTDASGKTIVELNPDNIGAILPESSRIFTFTPTSELPNEQMTATLSAVDQNGQTADKSIQLNHEIAQAATPAEIKKEPRNYLYWLVGIIPIIAILGAANRFMAYRKPQAEPPTPPEDTPPKPSDTSSSI